MSHSADNNSTPTSSKQQTDCKSGFPHRTKCMQLKQFDISLQVSPLSDIWGPGLSSTAALSAVSHPTDIISVPMSSNQNMNAFPQKLKSVQLKQSDIGHQVSPVSGLREAGPMQGSASKHINALSCTECLLCTETFLLPDNVEEFLLHLFRIHHLVIADIHCIADIKGYVYYWRSRLRCTSLAAVCTTMHAAVKKETDPKHIEGTNQEFFLLSDVLPEDRLLRQGLHEKRLEWVLEQQRRERENIHFTRGCLFCRAVLTGTVAQYLNHLSQQHNLQLGRPHNLVFIDEMIDCIEDYFNQLQCLYCEKFFKDRLVLREHMRKKMHKRINPGNHAFDKYYVVNYLEMGKDWVQVEQETEEPEPTGFTSGSEAAEGDVADWNDWSEAGGIAIICLFCDFKHDMWTEVLQHLKEIHSFNFLHSVAQLDFYQKVKLVNYIRRQIDHNTCINCEKKCQCHAELLQHMNEAGHFSQPEQKLWDQPEYYFPTHEDDGFLCQLDDTKDDGEGTPECVSSEEPDPQLCEALTEAHISEVSELKAALSPSITTEKLPPKQSPSTSTKINNVTFKE